MISDNLSLAQLVVALDRPGPRYTSYPTVPAWSDTFAPAELERALERAQGPADIYVHIPFCREQCWFCGCNQVVSTRQSSGDRYLDALELELGSLALSSAPLEAARIHLGGGTPNWLEARQLERLYRLLFERFRPIAGAELSVELDPALVAPGLLPLLASFGVNRISVGVQSTDARVLAAINRPQRLQSVQAVVEEARGLGMQGINIDLVYGLPHQDRQSFLSTVDAVIALRPDRLATYSYAHVPWLKKHQQQIDTSALPAPADKLGLFLHARERLTDAGYLAVGMDHFALPGDPLAQAALDRELHRNFMGYTTRGGLPLIGVGVSAITELDGVYAQAEPHLGAWYRAIEGRTQRKIVKGRVLTAEDKLRRDVIASLMCNFEVDKASIERQHAVCFDQHFADALHELAPLVEHGLCELLPERIEVTALGRLLVRNVAMTFDEHREGPRYSSTV
jgi:oxygen-independent coproporphyrinogen-3 oxidase